MDKIKKDIKEVLTPELPERKVEMLEFYQILGDDSEDFINVEEVNDIELELRDAFDTVNFYKPQGVIKKYREIVKKYYDKDDFNI
jgi:hypothetical protein